MGREPTNSVVLFFCVACIRDSFSGRVVGRCDGRGGAIVAKLSQSRYKFTNGENGQGQAYTSADR